MEIYHISWKYILVHIIPIYLCIIRMHAYKSVCVHISYDWLIGLLDPSGFCGFLSILWEVDTLTHLTYT